MRSWELTLQGRMVATLAALALCGAWMTGDSHACLAAALLTAPLLVDLLWRGGGLPPLQVAVAERRTQAGSVFLETIHVRNAGSRRAVRDLRIAEPRTSTRAGSGYLENLPPGSSATIRLPARCLRRGRHELRLFRCETSYPLGLLRNRTEIHYATDLTVEPARTSLNTSLLRSTEERTESAQQSPRGNEEFFALREYRYGEDARQVHALRSASASVLVRKVMRGLQPRHPCLVLDLRRPPGRGAAQTGRLFEWSLSAAATLLDHLQRDGSDLVCFVLGKQCQTFRISSHEDAETLLGFLADARPSLHITLQQDVLEEIREHDSCLWIPAGGFEATQERGSLSAVTVVSGGRGDA